MVAVVVIASLVALGGLLGVFYAEDSRERLFDLTVAVVAGIVLAIAALVYRRRHGAQALRTTVGPIRAVQVVLIYAIVIPGVVYWVIVNALHLRSESRGMLAAVLGLGGFGLALWRWNRSD